MITPEYLLDYLRNHTDITDEVGTTADNAIPITGELHDNLAKLMPRKAIVVTAVGGPEWVGRNHDFARGRMDVRCYGKTVAEAWALHDVVYRVLRYGQARRSMNGKQAVSVRPSGGGIQDRDREGGWPYVWGEYLLVISEG